MAKHYEFPNCNLIDAERHWDFADHLIQAAAVLLACAAGFIAAAGMLGRAFLKLALGMPNLI